MNGGRKNTDIVDHGGSPYRWEMIEMGIIITVGTFNIVAMFCIGGCVYSETLESNDQPKPTKSKSILKETCASDHEIITQKGKENTLKQNTKINRERIIPKEIVLQDSTKKISVMSETEFSSELSTSIDSIGTVSSVSSVDKSSSTSN